MIEARFEKGEVEAFLDAGERPGNRVRFIAAHHQAADFLLVVDEALGIAKQIAEAR